MLPKLRELLTLHPALLATLWRLGQPGAEGAWANLAAGSNLYLRECLLLQTEAMREDLAGPHPSPIVRLLAERVVATWLQVNYFDAIAAQASTTHEKPKLAIYRARRQEQAQRAHLSALAALATLRRLLPSEIGSATIHPMSGATANAKQDGQHHYILVLMQNSPGKRPQIRIAGFFDGEPASKKKVCQQQK